MADNKFIKIMETDSRIEAEQVLRFLGENNVNAYQKGGVMDIYLGNAVGRHDIMVGENDYEAAKSLLQGFSPIRTNGGAKCWYTSGQKKWGIALLVFVVIFCVCVPLLLL